MAVPKYRTSASKRDMRRSHHRLSRPGMSVCSNCGETHRPHRMCTACGFYKGAQVVQVKKTDLAWSGETGEVAPEK